MPQKQAENFYLSYLEGAFRPTAFSFFSLLQGIRKAKPLPSKSNHNLP